MKAASATVRTGITVHGRAAAVVLSARDDARLTGARRRSLLELMRNSPLYGAGEPESERDRNPVRKKIAL